MTKPIITYEVKTDILIGLIRSYLHAMPEQYQIYFSGCNNKHQHRTISFVIRKLEDGLFLYEKNSGPRGIAKSCETKETIYGYLALDRIFCIDAIDDLDECTTLYNEEHHARYELNASEDEAEYKIVEERKQVSGQVDDRSYKIRDIPLNKNGQHDGVEEAFFFLNNKSLVHRYWCNGKEVTLQNYQKEVCRMMTQTMVLLPELNAIVALFVV